MRKLISLLSIAVLLAASPAWANSCPGEMKAIDAKLPSATLSKEAAAEVAKLRAEGEAHHKAGRHAESMAALGKAKKLLGI